MADMHVSALGQFAPRRGAGDEFRYGVEVGAAVRVVSRVSLGVDVQASRTLRRSHRDGWGAARLSVVPMLRLRYAPGVPRWRPTSEPR